jgi:hypothetical protein
MRKILAAVLLSAVILYAQGSTGRLDGSITDPQGASVPGAEIQVLNIATGQLFKTTSNERGEWTLTTMPSATYRLSVSKPGFKSGTVDNVVMNAGVPATVNVKLELGQATETVEVSGGAEIIQATSASVSSTLTGRQVFQLPFATRNAVELLVTQPGTQTPTNPRSSTINGLPKGSLNVTIDGLNSQESMLKSSDGFFSYIYTPVDAIDEITLTTSAASVDATGAGAAQIKFVTKSGTNEFHPGAFWQVRNSALNANYWFNNRDGLPRDQIKLNQLGAHFGGPIKKNRLFLFGNYEIYRLPSTLNFTRTLLTDKARSGVFTYQDTVTKLPREVNLYQVAAAGNANLPAGTRPYATTPDPIVAATLDQIAKLTAGGNFRDLIATNNDYNRRTFSYQPASNDKRDFLTGKLDYDINSRHHFSATYNYNWYDATPDGLNSVVPVYPGTGTVLGSNINAGQRSNRYLGSVSLRSALTPTLTNELRAGAQGGTLLFRDQISTPALFAQWRGYIPNFGGAYISSVNSVSTSSRRNSPTKEIADNVSWIKGSHQLGFGGSYNHVNLWQQSVNTNVLPGITFNVAAGDPIATGTTNIFTSGNFPNLSSTDLTSAQNLYALLTGRVSSISRQLSLDETSHKYDYNPSINRDRIREYGLYVSDTWRVAPNLTLNAGLRYEKQFPFENLNNTYTRVGIEGIWGISGVGNLFRPGVTPGKVPQYTLGTAGGDAYKIPAVWAPSIGAAWQLPKGEGLLGVLLGKHQGAAVLRGGYSIANIREGWNVFTSVWGSNQGLNADASLAPNTFPADFGAPGSVWFRDATLPSRSGLPTTPVYPIAASFSSSINEFDPKLKMGYVQSWNIGFQRELGKDMVMEVRYTGNHGVHEWRQYNINEVNIFENGFLNEFNAAASNLAIARLSTPGSNNYGNQGLAGQRAIPILQTAIGNTSDATTASNIGLGAVGTIANSIATNATRLGNLTKAGYPENLFQANPTVAGGGAFLVANDGASFYDALQIEWRRRMTRGISLQGSYVWSHSIANGATNSATDSSQPTTLRNLRLDRVAESFDIRHAVKVNWIYELPFGGGRRFLVGITNPIARKTIEGWQFAGVARYQSGVPFFFNGIATYNATTNNTGVVLHNIDGHQLQSLVTINKTTGADGKGIVYFLPQDLIANTQAAFQTGGKTLKDLNPNAPYIGPAAPGTLGGRAYVYGPWQRHFDVSLVKITKIGEKRNVEFRAQALNVFNQNSFLLGSNIGASFGQITSAYRDTNGTVDPGGRILEFVLRLNF